MKANLSLSRRKYRLSVADIVIGIILTIVCLSMLYPFLNLLYVSISDMSKITAAGGLLLYPQSIRFDAYEYIFNYNNMWNSFKNTVFITFAGTFWSLLVTCCGGYSVSQRDLPGRNIMTAFVLITMFFSGGLIPSYLLLKQLHLLNTLWVLILPGVSAWNLFLARNFFQSIPSELSESARIDGASETKIFISLIVPLSTPIIATLALFYGLGYWNTYSHAIIYNTRQDLQTMQVIIKQLYSAAVSAGTDSELLELKDKLDLPPAQTVRAAAVIIATVPILALYPYLQKYFTKGIMVGSLKG